MVALLGAVGLILYGVGIPIMMGLLMWLEVWSEEPLPAKQQCGHSGCLAGRKCLIAFILVFFREDGRLSLLGCAVVLIGSVLVEKRTHPFEVDSIS